MTVAAQTPPLKFDTIEEAIRAVRRGGMRLSTARRLAAEGPVSAVHLARTLLIDGSSVYRNLEVLKRHGLIRHVHLGHGPGLYVLVGRDEDEYLYCNRCAKVTPAAPERLDAVRERSNGSSATRRASRTSRSSDSASNVPRRRGRAQGIQVG